MTRVNSTNAKDYDILRLLQEGVYVTKADDVNSVSAFVCKTLQLESEQFRSEIKTIFLNGRVVDDPDTAKLHPGDVLVLSGAMPGLVGAMFRSDSPYKSMRATITSVNRSDNRPLEAANSMIRLKLFNTVLRDHRQAMIARGFWIPENR